MKNFFKDLVTEVRRFSVAIVLAIMIAASIGNMWPSFVSAQSVPAGGIAYKNLLMATNSGGFATGDLRIDCRGSSAVTFATSSTVLSTFNIRASATGGTGTWLTEASVSPSNTSVFTTYTQPGAFYELTSATSGYNLSAYISCK